MDLLYIFVGLPSVLIIIGVSIYGTFLRIQNQIISLQVPLKAQLERKHGLIVKLIEQINKIENENDQITKSLLDKVVQGVQLEKPLEQIEKEIVIENLLEELFDRLDKSNAMLNDGAYNGYKKELSDTEVRLKTISVEYNNTIAEYNAKITTFPSNVIASIANFEALPLFSKNS